MQQKKKVQVLMSTYQGEKYLRDQLDSILAQTYKNIEILVRDDGSADATIDILEEYAAQKKLTYIKGKNCGAAKSFLRLLKKADRQADYYALSDQDDVWEPDKLERAVRMLEQQEKKEERTREKGVVFADKVMKDSKSYPLMYCSALDVVDQNLTFLYKEGEGRKTADLSFGNAMVENCCTGCTIVINGALQKLIAEKRIPECSMHDWWLYLLASCFGKVLYDPEAHILYRQHEHNVIGMEAHPLERLKKKIRGFQQGRNVISCQLMEFYRLYHPEGEKGKLLRRFLSAKQHPFSRLFLCMDREIYRQGRINDVICRILMLTGSM